jgi:hypothetical protein
LAMCFTNPCACSYNFIFFNKLIHFAYKGPLLNLTSVKHIDQLIDYQYYVQVDWSYTILLVSLQFAIHRSVPKVSDYFVLCDYSD